MEKISGANYFGKRLARSISPLAIAEDYFAKTDIVFCVHDQLPFVPRSNSNKS